MPQNLIQLPKEVDITMPHGDGIRIKNHEITDGFGLFEWLHQAIKKKRWGVAVTGLEKHGISFEMVIECCAREMDDGYRGENNMFLYIIWFHYKFHRQWKTLKKFSESGTGKALASEFVPAIRESKDWDGLYDMIRHDGDFHDQMTKRIRNGINYAANNSDREKHGV